MNIQAAETSQPSNSSRDLPGCVFGPAARTDEGAFELQAAAVGGGAVWREGISVLIMASKKATSTRNADYLMAF